MKMLTKVGRAMHEQSETFNKKENCKKVPNGTHRTEEYNNWAEKFSGGVQQQTRSSETKNLNFQNNSEKMKSVLGVSKVEGWGMFTSKDQESERLQTCQQQWWKC